MLYFPHPIAMPTTPYRKIIVVCGPPRSGKSTISAILAKETGLHTSDCSSIIYRELARDLGTTVEDLMARNKEEIRPSLIRTGDRLCEADPAYLAKVVYTGGARIITGVRRVSEFNGLRQWLMDHGEEVVLWWIDRPGIEVIRDNTEAELIHLADVRFHNLPTQGNFDDVRNAAIVSLKGILTNRQIRDITLLLGSIP